MWRALAISLAAHALLLWPGAAQRLPERAAGALVATLRPAVPPAAVPAAPARAPVPHAAPLPAVAPALATVSPAPTFSVPPVTADAASTVAIAERSAPAAVSATASVAATPAAARVAAAGAETGVDAEGQRQYRLALAREARRYKRYPERALLAGIGGTAEVRIEHDAGAPPVARLVRSSGHEALDAAALEMMRQAAPRTAVPEPLRGRAFAVSLPVVFDVEE